jgi:ParB family chromosome partitioning protein
MPKAAKKAAPSPDAIDITTIDDAGIIALVALSGLYVHALNTRSEPPAEDIEALADSIAELGLMQNLNGFADPDIALGAIGIVAGGRRLRALLLLAERDNRDTAQTMVPVRITSDADTAQYWANAENTTHKPPHPADEVAAYGRMAATGADPSKIARAFAVSTLHVQRRLKLATLPAPALQALRENAITLDQAAALTVARNDEALLAELHRVLNSGWAISSSSIRGTLLGDKIRGNDRRFKYIGLEAYQHVGGIATTDLFSDEITLQDDGLLHKLFDAGLRAQCETTALEGWKWVKPCFDDHTPYNDAAKLHRIHKVAVDLPEADSAELATLCERAEREELTDAEIDRMAALETRAEGDYADADIATSGLWLYVDPQGDLCRYGPFCDPKDAPGALGDENDPEGDQGSTNSPPESRALPANLLHDLACIRLAALQDRALFHSKLMLDLLGYQLSGNLSAWGGALRIDTSPANISPDKPEGTTLPARLLAAHGKTGKGGNASPEGFAAFQQLGEAHRNTVLAQALAALIPSNDLAPVLAAQLCPDVRSLWAPTKSAYLSRLPSSALDDIWCNLTPDDRTPNHADFAALKKADKADLLHKLFNDSDWREAFGLSREENARIDTWLPAELEWPAVEIGGAE